jgi:hypothetical protein
MFDDTADITNASAKPSAQAFIDSSLAVMAAFKPDDVPSPLREAFERFPPQDRLTAVKVLVGWSIRTRSPNYEALSSETFLLAVPVAQGCWAATFDACRLWNEPPAAQGAGARAFQRLNALPYGSEPPMADALLHTLARSLIDTTGTSAWLSRAIALAWPACLFVGALGVGRNQPRRCSAVAVLTAAQEPLQTLLASGVPMPPYARAIFDGEMLRRR